MISLEDEYFVALESVYGAVRSYAKPEIDALIKKIIYRLRRIPASGIFMDAYVHKTQWDEYCHEIQDGPYDLPEACNYSNTGDLWDETIDAIVHDIIEHIPRRSAVLLSIFAAWELDEDENLSDAAWPDGISRVLKSGLDAEAGARNLFRFSPWRNG